MPHVGVRGPGGPGGELPLDLHTHPWIDLRATTSAEARTVPIVAVPLTHPLYSHRMLDLRPNCECCDRDLSPDAEAYICTFECTWCPGCVDRFPGRACPNCGGDLQRRPTRPASLLGESPAGLRRVVSGGVGRGTRHGPRRDGDSESTARWGPRPGPPDDASCGRRGAGASRRRPGPGASGGGRRADGRDRPAGSHDPPRTTTRCPPYARRPASISRTWIRTRSSTRSSGSACSGVKRMVCSVVL